MVDACYKVISRIVGQQPKLERYQVNAITGGTEAQGEVSLLCCATTRSPPAARACTPTSSWPAHSPTSTRSTSSTIGIVAARRSASRGLEKEGVRNAGSRRSAIFPGDGIGPEVIARGAGGVGCCTARFGLRLSFAEGLIGGGAIDADGTPLPAASLSLARQATRFCSARWAVRVGRPAESGTSGAGPARVAQRARPVRQPAADPASSRAPRCGAAQGRAVRSVDILFVRELTGGIYFGKPSERRSDAAGRDAVDTIVYTEPEVERVVRLAFSIARERRRRVTRSTRRTFSPRRVCGGR